MRKYTLLLLPLCAMFLAACQSSGPKRAADDFVRAYYQNAQLEQAAALSSDAALERIHRELSLRQGQDPTESRRSRKISARRSKTKILNKDKQIHLFDLHIATRELSFDRQAMITLTRRNGAWKVSFFKELS